MAEEALAMAGRTPGRPTRRKGHGKTRKPRGTSTASAPASWGDGARDGAIGGAAPSPYARLGRLISSAHAQPVLEGEVAKAYAAFGPAPIAPPVPRWSYPSMFWIQDFSELDAVIQALLGGSRDRAFALEFVLEEAAIGLRALALMKDASLAAAAQQKAEAWIKAVEKGRELARSDPKQLSDAVERLLLVLPEFTSPGFLENLSPALRVVQVVGPRRFHTRVVTFPALESEWVPYLTLQELGQALHAFASALSEQTDFISRTGHPESPFGGSRWLASRLWTYPTKPFLEQNTVYTPGSGERFSYGWGSLVDSVRHDTYEAAPTYGTLPPRVIARLDELRPRVVRLKLEVINLLADAVEDRRHRDLLDRCIRKVEPLLDSRDALALEFADNARIESFRTDDVPNSMYGPDALRHGSLGDLFWLVGHVENELRSRTWDELKTTLEGCEFSTENRFSYFEALASERESEVSAALDQFAEQTRREQAEFWPGFRGRVEAGLADFLHVPVLGLKVRRSELELAAGVVRYGVEPLLTVKRAEEAAREAPPTAEVREAEEKGYKFLRPVEIQVVRRDGRQKNVVVVDGQEHKLPLAVFRAFLQLTLASASHLDFVEGEDLAEENHYSRVRDLRKSLGPDGEKLVENVRDKGYRLSLPPSLLTWNDRELAEHPDKGVQKLAARLKQARSPQGQVAAPVSRPGRSGADH